MSGEKKIITRKQLSGNSKYDYCPFCVRELEAEGKEWKEILRPLFQVKIAEPMKIEDGQWTRDYIETRYECGRCKNDRIDTEVFVKLYCSRPDGTKYTEPPREVPNGRRAVARTQAAMAAL